MDPDLQALTLASTNVELEPSTENGLTKLSIASPIRDRWRPCSIAPQQPFVKVRGT